MKKHIKIFSILSVPFFALGIHFGVKTTTNIKKTEALSITETIYWGINGKTLYLASSNETEISSCGTKGSFTVNNYDPLNSIPCSNKSSIEEVTILNRIAPTDCTYFFAEMGNLKKINNIINFDTTNVISMQEMFSGANYDGVLDLSSFRTTKVKKFGGMFRWYKGTSEIKLSNFDTSNAEDITEMFHDTNCDADVSGFEINKIADCSGMFDSALGFKTIRFRSFEVDDYDTSPFYDTVCDVVDLSNAKGEFDRYILDGCDASVVVLPKEVNLKGTIVDIGRDNRVPTLVFTSTTVPEFNELEYEEVLPSAERIIVPNSSVENYKNGASFGKCKDKIEGAYFINTNVKGFGSITIDGYDGNFICADELIVDNDVCVTLNPANGSMLSENGVSIADSLGNPIDFDDETWMFEMPNYDVTINVTFERTGSAYTFAKTFLQQTGDVCSAVGGQKLVLLQGIWGDLVTAYNELDIEDKGILEEDVKDVNIAAMLERYSYILSKYNTETTKNLVEFIDGFTITYSARDSFIKTEDFDTTLILLISIISAGGLLTILLSNKKRRLN